MVWELVDSDGKWLDAHNKQEFADQLSLVTV